MKQKGVTKEALTFIKRECLSLLDIQNITPTKAFNKPLGDIVGIPTSGRTLRKIFNGEQVHVHTIEKIIEAFGKETCLTNGKIDIKDESDKINIEGATDAETVSKEG